MNSLYGAILVAYGQQNELEVVDLQKIDCFRQYVAEFESGSDPEARQKGGPGRGLYQYELLDGGSGANITAYTRLRSVIKEYGLNYADLPGEDRRGLAKHDPDFSKLTADTQNALFLADKIRDPKTHLEKITELPDSTDPIKVYFEVWRDGHWKGPQYQKETMSFNWHRRFAIREVACPTS